MNVEAATDRSRALWAHVEPLPPAARFDLLWDASRRFFMNRVPVTSDNSGDNDLPQGDEVRLWRYALSDAVHQAAEKDAQWVERLELRWRTGFDQDLVDWLKDQSVFEAWVLRWDAWLGASALRQLPSAFMEKWPNASVQERAAVSQAWQGLMTPALRDRWWAWQQHVSAGPDTENRHEALGRTQRMAIQMGKLMLSEIPGWNDPLWSLMAPVFLEAMQHYPTAHAHVERMFSKALDVASDRLFSTWAAEGHVERWSACWAKSPPLRAAWRAYLLEKMRAAGDETPAPQLRPRWRG